MNSVDAFIKDTKSSSWSSINWAKAHRTVNNLQRRIFVAKQEGRFRALRKLQKLLLTAQSNRLLAARQVCQVNSGRITPGVDNRVYLSPQARMLLVKELAGINMRKWKAIPARRTYIFKSNGKLRPLGIPTLIDRALQCIVKSSLEPEWEAVFEPSSYGFRPSRSAHDAITKIHSVCNARTKKHWIVDADIKECFDNIDHNHLLETLKGFPAQELVRKWLKAGYIDKNVFYSSTSGVPQGCVISPLLANITLHGMECALGIKSDKKGWFKGKRTLIRYADDFIVACTSKAEAQEAVRDLKNWLKMRGLGFSPEKTRIVNIEEGFNFLGFLIRLYKAQTPLGRILLIKPNKDCIKKLRYKLKTIWNHSIGQPAYKIIAKLNPILWGWSNYFPHTASKETFSSMDHYMYTRTYCFVKRTHPNKSWKWKKSSYWGKFEAGRNDRWVFGDKKKGSVLKKFSWTRIKRCTMVTGTYSPFDPSLKTYWEKRSSIRRSPSPRSHDHISKHQNHKCPVCMNLVNNGESIQTHHIHAKSKGGKDSYSNLSLLHTECHKKAHTQGLDDKYITNRLRLFNPNLRCKLRI